MPHAWVVSGGEVRMSPHSFSAQYTLTDTGKGFGTDPPPVPHEDLIAVHTTYQIVPEGLMMRAGSSFTFNAVLFLRDDSPAPIVTAFSDPVGSETWIDETTAGPDETLHRFGSDLYAANWPIMFDYNTFPVNDEIHIRFKKLDSGDVTGTAITSDNFTDFDFTQTIPFNNDGFSDWRGPWFIAGAIYFWFMDAETLRMSLWANSLDTPTEAWTEAYGEDAAIGAQFYIGSVVQMVSGRRVAVSKGTLRPHVLYAESPYTTWTPVAMDAGFNPLEFGVNAVGDGIVAVQNNSSALKYWFSMDGVTGWTLETPSVASGNPFVIKNTAKVITDGLHFLVTTRVDASGHMGPLALFGTLAGGFVGLENFPDYASWTDTQRHYADPRINWGMWHSGRGTWLLNVIAASYPGGTNGYSYVIEYSADMTTEIKRWSINILSAYHQADGMSAFQSLG